MEGLGVRIADVRAERRVSWLETFFDLVFVAAVGDAALIAFDHFTPLGFGHFAIVFVPVWWAWIGATFYATRFEADDAPHLLLSLGQMGGVAGMAVFSHTALGAGGPGFALSYALVRVLLIAQYLRAGRAVPAARGLVRGYATGFGAAVALWLLSLAAPPEWRSVAWFAAIAVDLATPSLSRRHALKLPPHLAHVPERFGLFTIIVLGECVAAVSGGIVVARLGWEQGLAACAGLCLAFGIWWDYFHGIGASRARSSLDADHGRSFTLWMYLHLPFTGLLLLLAAGVRLAVEAPSGARLPSATVALLCAVASATMLLGALLWATAPRLTAGRTTARQMAPYLLLAGCPMLGALFGAALPPAALIVYFAALYAVRVARAVRDYRLEAT